MAMKKDENDVLPFTPILFDKKRLGMKEFEPYMYEIKFKKSGKSVKDMSLAGYIHAISPYLKSINSEMLQLGYQGERKVSSCVVKCTIVVTYKTTSSCTGGALSNEMQFSALADGDVTAVPSSDVLVRTVETRALKRAIARALNISKSDFNEGFIEEEEYGTPMRRDDDSDDEVKPATRKMKSPAEIAAENEQKMKDRETVAGGDW